MSDEFIEAVHRNGLLTQAEAARYLGVPESWIRYKWSRRELPAVKLGHHLRFRREDLDREVAEHVVPAVR